MISKDRQDIYIIRKNGCSLEFLCANDLKLTETISN